MILKTFDRGTYVPHYKKLTESKAITPIPLPKEVVIPLQQHAGAPCHALVSVGDEVSTAQKIGESNVLLSAFVHSSVNGIVTAIEPRPFFTGALVESVVIEVTSDRETPGLFERNLAGMTGEEIVSAVREAGIVGMGGAAFPTHIKLAPPKAVDTILINACECEPFLTCDHRMLIEMTDQIIEGARLIAKAVNASQIFFGIEANKPDAVVAVDALIDKKLKEEIVVLDVKYPQGAEKQLIKAALNREVPPGKLPFEVGVIVQNVATAIAVYEACRFAKPLYERVLTVSGDGSVEPCNVLARIGTPVNHIIEHCGGFKGSLIKMEEIDQSDVRYPIYASPHLTGKIIMGGPMTGWAIDRLDIPVVKGTSGILIFTPAMVTKTEHLACVRCSKCVEHCPMFLYPNFISMHAETGRYNLAVKWGALDCFECGVCAFVCPSNRPIVQHVRETKKSRH